MARLACEYSSAALHVAAWPWALIKVCAHVDVATGTAVLPLDGGLYAHAVRACAATKVYCN